jgi:hypothetical protein
MAMNRGFPRQRRLTLDEQIYQMSVLYSGLPLHARKRQLEATWRGVLHPSPISDKYLVSIRYRIGWCPEVRVLSPNLKIREGAKSLPHLNANGSLCLHIEGEWQSWMFLAESIVPWASFWLYFYEVWYATGLWLGGGTHPEKPEHRSK